MQNIEPDLLPILRTETLRDLLDELYFGSDGPRTLSDLARAIGVNQTTVMREVNRIEESGLLLESRVGRSRTVAIDDRSPLAGPLRALLQAAQVGGEEEDERRLGDVFGGHRPFTNGRHRRPLPSSQRRR